MLRTEHASFPDRGAQAVVPGAKTYDCSLRAIAATLFASADSGIEGGFVRTIGNSAPLCVGPRHFSGDVSRPVVDDFRTAPGGLREL